ncbi:MAG: hypothetical protein AB7F96_11505 [Beijerinckiaceae bacterium]
MRIYANTRDWRALGLLWFFAFLFVVSIAAGLYAMATGNEPGMQLSFIFTPILLVFTGGMEFYCRRYIRSIDIEDDDFIVETRGLFASYRTHGIGSVGDRIDSKLVSNRDASRLATVMDSLRPLQLASIDNQFHFLKVGPQKKRFILDVTADPQAGARIAQALKEARSGPKK